MAGKASPQITAAAPAPTPAPSEPAVVAATGTEQSPNPPPAPVAEKAKPTKAKPSKGMAIQATAAPDTSENTRAEFESLAHALEAELNGEVEEGKAGKGKEKPAALKATEPTKPTEKDEIQKELDAAAEAAGLKTAETEVATEPEKEKTPEKAEETEVSTEETEAPESSDAEVYEAWKKTLSKAARNKIERLEKKNFGLQAAAAERIVLQPTSDAPLSHITNLEQLEAETAYWKDVRAQVKSGEIVKIKGADGKRLELDPEIEEDKAVIDGYSRWAEAAIEAAPDAKERIKTRASSKPWEAAEKLAPGMISDKESFANKKALEFLKSNPHMVRDPNYEVHLAHMVRSIQMDEDQKPTAEYPKGKFKYVKLPLDKEGNVIPKKAPVSTKEAGKKPPTVVETTPRSVVKTQASQQGYAEALTKAETSHSEEDMRDALRALLK